MGRGLLLAIAGAIVVGGIAVAAVLVFPTRYGCGDGTAAFATSEAVATSSCGSTATRFPTDSAVVRDERVVPRVSTAVIALVALVLLFRLASRHDVEPDLPDTWRPYG